MKLKYTIAIVLFLSVITLNFSQCLSDNFDTNYGNWTDSGTYRTPLPATSGNGVGFNDLHDYIVTKSALTNPKSIKFQLAKSVATTTRSLSIQYSTTGSGSWNDVETITAETTSTTHQEFNINLNLTGLYFIRIIMSHREGGSFYLDDVSISCENINAPELQILDALNNPQNCGFTSSFEDTYIGETKQITLTLKNTGDVDLEISEITTTNNFTTTEIPVPVTILPNENLQLTIIFHPDVTGPINGSLNIINTDTNEGNCNIILLGTGIESGPEIDIERNTEASIPSGAEANIGYNTIFASTQVGETANSKSYYIHNEGNLDLTIYDVTSSNASEFKILSNPEFSTISSETKIPFQIEFTPSTSGIRTSIINIGNNDSNENPYTFEVQGTGICSSSTLMALPSSGPVGTVVTITDSDFGTETTANLNGVSALVTPISETEIEVTIPENATSGNLTITNDLGCSSETNFNLITTTLRDCDGAPEYTPTDLFISEITDHPTGSHSYIEIFNGTGTAVNLADYTIEIHYNATTIRSIPLEHVVLKNRDVYVIAFGAKATEYPNSTYGFDQLSTYFGINGNDHIRLYKNENWIDVWGTTTGEPFTMTPKGYTYRRKNNLANLPGTTWDTNDWNVFSTEDYTDIGHYDFVTGSAPTISAQPSNTTANCSLSVLLNTTAQEGFSGQKSLTYQWLYNQPGDDMWHLVSNDDNHDGAQTSTLHILNTVNVNGNQYFCRVQEDSELCFTATHSTKIALDKSVWNGSAWEDNREPTLSSFTILNNNFTTALHGNITTCGLYIPIDNTLTIDANTFVKVDRNLIVEGNVIVKNQGSFVQVEDTPNTNSGTITVEKETAILKDWLEYTYWSTPVSNASFEDVFAHSKRLYWFKAANFVDIYKEENNNNAQELGQDDVDDDANDWQAISELESIKRTDKLQAGVGYAATHSSTNFTSGLTYTYSFTGDFNNGTILTPIERNDVSTLDSNWNLIGNPYPSAIDVDAFFDANVHVKNPAGPLEGVIYLWSHDTPPSKDFNGNHLYNFSPSDYAIINGSGSIAAQQGTGTKPDNYIPSCQGFFVKFSDDFPNAYANVEFNNSMRVTDKNTQFFRASNTNKIWLNLTSNNGVFSQTLISYTSGATDDYDGSYFDLETHISKDISAKLYSTLHQSDKKLVIQGKASQSISIDEDINLGFYTSIKVPTIFTIAIDDFEGSFLTENPLFLEDRLLNTFHDLKESGYKFTSETGVFNNRFYISFKAPALHTDDLEHHSKLSIIQHDENQWLFKLDSNQLQMESIKIHNTLGQEMHQIKTNENRVTCNLPNLKSGMYLLSAYCTNGTILNRKFIAD
ncbi:choice-of-anchor D domain-containing protein [Formosa haliotis]|uniref:choice-of-anchor D domain-containing protein n=1 Tax=Formosa haliotis TaxID=1555194 RepID=UPI0008270005|nr:choice-of-anchor D domain-containing protein [Formosa haliotis]